MRIVPVIFGCILAGYSSVGVLFDARYETDSAKERAFCRWGVCADPRLLQSAYQQLWEGGAPQQQAAIEGFREALRRDPIYPYRWCDLGEALLDSDRTEDARYCFRQAVKLAPHLPPLLLRAANFYFVLGETREALLYTSRILKEVPSYDELLFSTYRRLRIDLDEVLSHGLPEDTRAAQSFLRHLIAGGDFSQSEKVWAWIQARSLADDKLAAEYLDFLVKGRRYDAAEQAWAGHLRERRGDYPEPNRVFNGDFEAEFTGALLDWRVEYYPAGVRVKRVPDVAFSGKWSVQVAFDGTQNLAYWGVSQLLYLRPGAYTLRANVRTDAISTDEGIGLRVLDVETPPRVEARTKTLVGTHDWTPLNAAFVVADRPRLLYVQVTRQPSRRFDSQIAGTAWVDAVRVERSR